MEELNSASFVFIDKNPKMELIGYTNLQKDNPEEEYFVEEEIQHDLVA